MGSAYWPAYRHLFSMLDNRRRMSRGGLPAVSRYRLVAAAIIPILAMTGCNSTASPSPSSPAGSAPAASSAASAPAASASAVAASPGTKFAGLSVNILTFNGPQVAEPLQRRAPDWEKLTGGHVNVVAVGFQTIYDKAL